MTMTSGAVLQSATSALAGGGATVVAALVIGRVIDVEFGSADKELWQACRRQRFSFMALLGGNSGRNLTRSFESLHHNPPRAG